MESLGAKASREPSQRAKAYKAGGLTTRQRKAVADAVKKYSGKGLTKQFEETLMNTKIHRGKDAPLNLSVWKLWEKLLPRDQLNVAINVLEDNRGSKVGKY